MCKPHKMGKLKRWKIKDQQLLEEYEKEKCLED